MGPPEAPVAHTSAFGWCCWWTFGGSFVTVLWQFVADVGASTWQLLMVAH